MKRRAALRILALVLVISAISFAVYPSVSVHEAQRENNQIIEKFDDVIEKVQNGNREDAADDGIINDDGYLIDDKGEVISEAPVIFRADLDRLYSDCSLYNESLIRHQDMKTNFSWSALDLNRYGIKDNVFGYITASSIGLNVPIFLGASFDNMARGCAHLMNTSLPIGGIGTNAVLAGHTGYIGRMVFDYIPRLNIGDIVSITTCFGTKDYRVTSKKEIGATETNDLYIVKDKDLLTLLTCARYGTARYEVICERA